MAHLDQPANDVLEISIFGGGTYGECIVVHLGFEKWLIIDSFKNPETKVPIAIEYLKSINVDFKKQVILVGCTHWHDDHIQGLFAVVESCESAKFCCSEAMNRDEFMAILITNSKINSQKAGANEISDILKYLKPNGRAATRAIQDRPVVIQAFPNGFKSRVVALSPSDESIANFQAKLAEALDKREDYNTVINPINPNHSSVVFLIEVGHNRIILGGDLEKTDNNNTGWGAVINSLECPDKTVEIFKFPHHGSENGYHEEFWEKAMIPNNPIVGLTTYNKGRKFLPSDEDIKRIFEKTNRLFITSSPKTSPQKKDRETKVEKILKMNKQEVNEVTFDYGHIRLRKKMEDMDVNNWNVDLFGEALSIEV